jgi:hypothetical protein
MIAVRVSGSCSHVGYFAVTTVAGENKLATKTPSRQRLEATYSKAVDGVAGVAGGF